MTSSRNPRTIVSLVLVVSGILTLSSLGAPSGCAHVGNVSLYSPDLDPDSPDVRNATWDNPALVVRDNPGFGGSVFVDNGNVSGEPGSKFFAHGKWTNLSGAVVMEERWYDQNLFDTQYGPLLPRSPYQSPGLAPWASRFGSVVHDNHYVVDVDVEAGGQAIQSKASLNLKLSDKVALVPVILITWRIGDEPLDWTHRGKALFDYLPYHKPLHMDSQLTLSDVQEPNQNVPITPPDVFEQPPDDIWTQCNIQFQVVASFVFELPNGTKADCTKNNPAYEDELAIGQRIKQALAADPALASLLVDQLQPAYVAYGPWECEGYGGKVVPGSRLVDVSMSAQSSLITTHELGHIFHLSDLVEEWSGSDADVYNLMGAMPGDHDIYLHPSQCSAAHDQAKAFSDRFREFNLKTKRTLLPAEDLSSCSIGGLPPSEICCENRDGQREITSPFECSGTSLDLAACQVCCMDRMDANIVWIDECRPDAVIDYEQCGLFCCSTSRDPDLIMTVYQCSLLGGVPVGCPMEEPK